MAGLHADEAKLLDYFNGTKVDPDSHSGALFEYYRRAITAVLHSSTITGAEHDYAARHASQAFRLRFWPGMVSNFWKTYGATVAKGYGTAAVPKYATMSRKNALAAIALFDTTAKGAAADQAEAKRLLTGLKDLDPSILNDNWMRP